MFQSTGSFILTIYFTEPILSGYVTKISKYITDTLFIPQNLVCIYFTCTAHFSVCTQAIGQVLMDKRGQGFLAGPHRSECLLS